MRFHRIAGLAGIGFSLVLILANIPLIASGFPTPSEAVTPADIVAAIDSGGPTLRIVSAMLPVTWLLGSIWAAGVFAAQSRRDSERGDAWAVIGLAGVLLQCVTFAAVEAVRLALIAVESPEVVAGFWALYNGVFGFNQVFLAMALLGFSLSGLRGRVIPRWHAAIGLTGSVALLASAATSPLATLNPLSLVGLAGWLLWVVWIFVYGIAMVRDRLTIPVKAG